MRINVLNNALSMCLIYICACKGEKPSIIENHLEKCESKNHTKQFQQELQDLKKPQTQIYQRTKRSIASNYEDEHCLKNFETKENAIIKTKESQANGAQYINETKVATFEFCLRICCETPLCNVAVYDIQDGNCYLFDCGTPEDFRCGFDVSTSFQSGALYINRHAFESSRYAHQDTHRSQLSRLNEALGEGLGADDEEEILDDGIQSARSMIQDSQPLSSFSSRRGGGDMVGNGASSFVSNSLVENGNDAPRFTGCRNPELEFQCASGNECIPIYDMCNGIPQCQDGSDENPTDCPPTTKKTRPTRIPKVVGTNLKNKLNTFPGKEVNRAPSQSRPGDVNHWGREGEKYRPNINSNSDIKASQQQPDNVADLGQTSFRHRGSPVAPQNMQQIPTIMQQNGMQSGQLQQPIYNQIQQQPLSPYNINGPQIGPRYDYTNPNLANYGYGNLNPNYGYSSLNRQGYYPVSSYANSGIDNRQMQQQQTGNVVVPQSPTGDASSSIQTNSAKAKSNQTGKSDKSKSGKKKTKSSNNKAAKSKLASKIISSKKGDTKSSVEDDEGRDTNSVVIDDSNVFGDTIKDTLLKDLKDSDFIMETPSAAIFTLVVGVSLSLVTCLVLFCRCRIMRRKGRKRNLASDADSDYLVNGMYL